VTPRLFVTVFAGSHSQTSRLNPKVVNHKASSKTVFEGGVLADVPVLRARPVGVVILRADAALHQKVAPIGKTVFGGLTFGTIMTLFLMPTIYAVINKNDDARREKSQARREGLAAGIKGKDLKKLKQEAAAAGPGSAPGTPSGTAVE